LWGGDPVERGVDGGESEKCPPPPPYGCYDSRTTPLPYVYVKKSINEEANLHRFKSKYSRVCFEIFYEQFLDDCFLIDRSAHFKFFAKLVTVRLKM
jgi:hypothetical protein